MSETCIICGGEFDEILIDADGVCEECSADDD